MKIVEAVKINLQKEEEINNKIKTYFFDPNRSRDDYWKIYKKCHRRQYRRDYQSCIRYSPLYYMRRELLFLLAEIPCIKKCAKGPKKLVEFYPVITSFIITQAAIEGLILDLNNFNRAKLYDVKSEETEELKHKISDFMKKYMHLKEHEIDHLDKLRNNLIHNFFKLISRNKKGEKIAFNLGQHTEIASLKTINTTDNKGKKYKIQEYKINPWKFHAAFEEGVTRLRIEIEKRGSGERELFRKNIHVYTWMIVPEA